MNKNVFLLVISLFISILSFSQTNLTAKGEGNGESVKLAWLFDDWQDGFEGIIIKRRTVSAKGKRGNWEQLIDKPIVPGFFKDKDISNLSNSSDYINELNSIRQKILIGQYMNVPSSAEISTDSVIARMKQRPDIVRKNLVILISSDYKVASLHGYGFADFKLPKNKSLEYGLFEVRNGQVNVEPSALFFWELGTKPNLAMNIKKTKIKRKQKFLELWWTLDIDDIINNTSVEGCDIYRIADNGDTIKLNKSLVRFNRTESESKFYYKDYVPNNETPYTYVLKGESVFGSEGPGYVLKYNPAEHPTKVEPPVLSSNARFRSDFVKNGVELKWEFNKELEPAIDGFLVQRRYGVVDDFQNISDTLKPDVRTFTDSKLSLTQGGKCQYQVSVVYDYEVPVYSNTLRLYYDPRPEVKATTNLKGEAFLKNNKPHVRLSWDKGEVNEANIQEYVIFTDYGASGMGIMSESKPGMNTSAEFAVFGTRGKKHRYCIAPRDKEGKVRTHSDTIALVIPNYSLAFIFEAKLIERNKAHCTWKMTSRNYQDLEGFRLYLDGELYEDGNALPVGSTEITLPELEAGRHKIELEAYTMYGVTKRIEQTVTVEEGK